MTDHQIPLPLLQLKQALDHVVEPTREEIERLRRRLLISDELTRRLDERWHAVVATAEFIGTPETPRLLRLAHVHWVDADDDSVLLYLWSRDTDCARKLNHPVERKVLGLALAAHFGLQWQVRCDAPVRR